MPSNNNDYYVLVIKVEGGTIWTTTSKFGEERELFVGFFNARTESIIEDAVLIKDSECIAFGDEDVYSTIKDLVFTHHLQK